MRATHRRQCVSQHDEKCCSLSWVAARPFALRHACLVNDLAPALCQGSRLGEVTALHDAEELLLVDFAVAITVGLVNHLLELLVGHVLTELLGHTLEVLEGDLAS